MKILYFAHHKNRTTSDWEADIVKAFEILGHEVVSVDDREFEMEDVIEKANKCDLFFFHKGGTIKEDRLNYGLSLQRLQTILQNIKVPKVYWYLDKFYDGREQFAYTITPLVDLGFATDESFIRRHNFHNLIPLHQGCPDEVPQGRKSKKFECDLAFIGSVYGGREMLVKELDKVYGDGFRVYNNVWGQEFSDVCKSAKIIISPAYPGDDYYWSNRIYHILAAGGMLLHPKREGLKQEFIINQHIAVYDNWLDLTEKVNELLKPENDLARETIAHNGQKHVMRNFTYSKRLKFILDICQQQKFV